MHQFQKVLVTGSNGFLGKRVIAELQRRGYENIIVPRKREYDLTEQHAVRQLLIDTNPELVIHLAAIVGGIGANQENPGKYFYDNLVMGIMLMEEARLNGVNKFLSVGTICSYPKFATIPFKEDDLWLGYPEETNAPYGLAKKMLLVQSQAYRQQYGFNAVHLMPVNLYGPEDNFDQKSSHVIPALIRKFLEAKTRKINEVILWGDGSPTREFLYVDDAACGIVEAVEKYNSPLPVNLGSGEEISIGNLSVIIAEMTGYTGEIKWDTSKPNGQPRRKLNIDRAKEQFDFTAKIKLKEGLKSTIDWYVSQMMALQRG